MNPELIDAMMERVRSGWCKGSNARDKDGRMTHYASDKAVSWCLVGAWMLSSDSFDERHEVGVAICKHVDEPRMDSWNDHPDRTKDEVLAMLAEVRAAAA